MSGLNKKLEQEVSAFQDLQRDYSKAVSSLQQLESQLKENDLVKKEFDLLDQDAVIYKLIGPVLVKQDQGEANVNVSKRIEFIRNEMERLEKQVKDLSEKQEAKKLEVVKLQTAIQQAQQAQEASA
ncbi:prefoldin subunit 6 [Polychytrium aggregatum]|uniref:prefoldin subunit 6 n=1 Tax=Polychytrium aggregatum TaxID=110093 RepID=UPI0022FF0EB6|nr:prefoldin subunit 6 [Polychytrium aggregatum]KAI9208672.1 prefoldin subunit 6 [Polychytrium aggregatum]